jgi:hypothetical protein
LWEEGESERIKWGWGREGKEKNRRKEEEKLNLFCSFTLNYRHTKITSQIFFVRKEILNKLNIISPCVCQDLMLSLAHVYREPCMCVLTVSAPTVLPNNQITWQTSITSYVSVLVNSIFLISKTGILGRHKENTEKAFCLF